MARAPLQQAPLAALRPDGAPGRAGAFDAMAVFAGLALTALLARLSLEVPGSPVPVTGQTLGALLAGGLLGARLGGVSQVVYLVAGAAGLPVFAGGAAGLEHLTGPTGGYLAGLVAAAGIAGALVERGWAHGPATRSLPRALAAMLLASAAVFALGVPWLAASGIGAAKALSAGLVPFLPGALLKAALAAGAVTLAARWRPAVGLALFAFIPLVLFLLVAHPRPIGLSLALAVLLMLGHRFLASPYPGAVREERCLWCMRRLPADRRPLVLATRRGELEAWCCARHEAPAARFFGLLDGARLPLAAGTFVPLLLLLAAVGFAAAGRPLWLDEATALFRLAVGLTVVAASLAYPLAAERRPPKVPFPVHNFFLLGVRALLWVFRIVGVWWIAAGAWFFLARL